MVADVILKFKKYFEELDLENSSVLDEIYDKQIYFQDPMHEIQGIIDLKKYFQKLNDKLKEGSFQFMEESIIDNKAYLSWELKLTLKKRYKSITASGISVLSFEDKITHQRDYFDAAQLFYEPIPILGGLIRLIKKKIVQ